MSEAKLSADDVQLSREVAEGLRGVTRYVDSAETGVGMVAQILATCEVQAEYFALGGVPSAADFFGAATNEAFVTWASDTHRALGMFAEDCLPVLIAAGDDDARATGQWIDSARGRLSTRLAGLCRGEL